MPYYIEEECTKAGYTPLDEDQWLRIITNGSVFGDTVKGSRRYRILELDGGWYCWATERHQDGETWHTCWQFNAKGPFLNKEEYKRVSFLIKDIENYS